MKMIKIIARLFFLAVILSALVAIHGQYSMYRYESTIGQGLQAKISDAQAIHEQLTHQLAHHLSDAYIEIAAREMGLVRQGEFLFRPSN